MAGKMPGLPEHGGRAFEVARRLGLPAARILDFSANINPLGPPPGLKRVVIRALSEIGNYPEPHAEPLRAALADHHAVEPSRVLVGNGSTALFYLLCRALRPGRAVVFEPAFSEYARALTAAGARISRVVTHRGRLFCPDRPRIDQALKSEPDLIFVARPVSPGGALPDGAVLAELIKRAAPAVVVLDEAFLDFTPQKSWAGQKDKNLIVTRSLTKFFALTGLRLGYLVGPSKLVARLNALDEPWSVNHLAQKAGLYCLDQAEYAARTRRTVDRLRLRLAAGIEALPGAQVYPATANYLLTRVDEPGPTVPKLAARLEAEGILIRDCANFRGVGPNHFRVAVRREAENRRLVAAMRKRWID
ncbi:MAG: threonine-phosphate decarboxylase CobD [Proteobacteria bacterium]|nr:threonine-phosphate decarboxylase CobD [Pseudomonadota bacterium]